MGGGEGLNPQNPPCRYATVIKCLVREINLYLNSNHFIVDIRRILT